MRVRSGVFSRFFKTEYMLEYDSKKYPRNHGGIGQCRYLYVSEDLIRPMCISYLVDDIVTDSSASGAETVTRLLADFTIV